MCKEEINSGAKSTVPFPEELYGGVVLWRDEPPEASFILVLLTVTLGWKN